MIPNTSGAALRHLRAADWNPASLHLPTRDQQAELLSVVGAEILQGSSSASAPITLAGVMGGYAAALAAMLGASWSRLVATSLPTESAQDAFGLLGPAPVLRKWSGPRAIRELNGEIVEIVTDDYEASIGFRAADLRRSKAGLIMQRVVDMAARVAFHPERVVSDVIAANGVASDGKAFFATDRVVGRSGTINNALAAADGLTGGPAPTDSQQEVNIQLLLDQLMAFLDAEGEPVNASARKFGVMVPSARMFGVTTRVLNASFTSKAASDPQNPLSAANLEFVPILNPRLARKDELYLFRLDAGIGALLMQEDSHPAAELGPESEHAKQTGKVAILHGWSGGVGYGKPELAVRGKLS